LGRAVTRMDPVEAGYRIGCTYTAAIPRDLRARWGAYYTPPALTKRLLDMATEAGVRWNSCRVLDPACGGGAFLTAIALRILDALDNRRPDVVMDHIESRIRGFEIDPFAAMVIPGTARSRTTQDLPLCQT